MKDYKDYKVLYRPILRPLKPFIVIDRKHRKVKNLTRDECIRIGLNTEAHNAILKYWEKMLPIILFLFLILQSVPVSSSPIGRVAEPKVKAAMKYHGIRFAEGTKKGDLIFYRNKKRCKLYTKSFEEYWKRRK